jgi:ribokinase
MHEGVSTRWVLRDHRAPTGASVLVSSHERNAAIFTFRGANTLLEPDDLEPEAFAVDLVHIASLSNQSADCFPLIIERAKAQGALVSANPGVRQLSARGGTFQRCLKHIDVLCLNRAEADVLVPSLIGAFGEGGPVSPISPDEDPPRLAARGLEGGGFILSLWAFLAGMRGLGARHIVLTDGHGGAYLGMVDEVLYCPALEAQVVGTAGAGDAFTATFAAMMALKRPPEEALLAAAVNATSVLGHADTQSGLLSAEQLERRLKKAAKRSPIRRWRLG